MGLSCVYFFCRASSKYTKVVTIASRRGNDSHEVGRNVGDADKKVRGEREPVTLRTQGADVLHVGRLIRVSAGEVSDLCCLLGLQTGDEGSLEGLGLAHNILLVTGQCQQQTVICLSPPSSFGQPLPAMRPSGDSPGRPSSERARDLGARVLLPFYKLASANLFRNRIIHSFNLLNKYLFSTYYMPDTILCAWDISMNKTGRDL